ncbi:ABC transporter permease [Croceitalea sp. P059]|uniref:ABC transporter permease n=1 Tax=Croceitalea sp. P059 TaxID=3075601 RepID=UPI0028875BF8|nr:ABC transporter permease [Croceitalea sp. P059]MDT0538626.1 FtsX-like permease family protein [Croceitalea sp. P059]
MFKSYLKIAWRNLIKNKSYLVINLTGLTVAMTCFVLIALFIQFEMSFDKHHENSEKTFRIIQQQRGNSYQGTDMFAVAPLPLGEALLNDFPEVENVTNLNTGGALLLKDELSIVQQGLYTDSSYFDVFTTHVVIGDAKTALKDPNNILITESLATKLFGEKSPMNQEIEFGNGTSFTVKGILENAPKNQHFTYDFIVSYKSQGYYAEDVGFWVSNNYHTYITLNDPSQYKTLENKMKVYESITKPAYANQGFKFYPEYKLQPLEDIHLKSKVNIELGQNGDAKYINLFALIAIIILVLAAINYTNLATAKSAKRAKEVGVNKMLGAKRGGLIVQYIAESLFLTFTALVLALFLSSFILPYFNELLNREISFNITSNIQILVILSIAAVLTGVFSGLYPAFFLSGIAPIKALKGNFLKSHKQGGSLKSILVISQFAVAIGLAIASVIIQQQLQYVQNKNLGYSNNQLVHVRYFESEITEKQEVLKELLLQNPNVNKVSLSSQLPFNVNSQGPVTNWEGNFENEPLYIYRTYVDQDFLDIFKMDIIEGRGFSKEIASDSLAYLLNESAVKSLGWETAIGKDFANGKVIGVLKDFHLKTFDQAIEPLFMALRTPEYTRIFGEVILQVNMENFKETSDFIVKTLKTIVPHVPYEVKFVEESYMQFYDEEKRLGKAFNIFTLLTLFIAAMGLFGMVSFQITQRSKEISIRKVLGSSVTNILKLLATGIFKQIIIALIIATPLAYYFMENWLQAYVYRISLQWWVAIIVGIIAMSLAFLSIGFQSIKAATQNPVKSLRNE